MRSDSPYRINSVPTHSGKKLIWVLIVGLVAGCAGFTGRELPFTREVSIEVSLTGSSDEHRQVMISARTEERSGDNDSVRTPYRSYLVTDPDKWASISITEEGNPWEPRPYTIECLVRVEGDLVEIPLSMGGSCLLVKATLDDALTKAKVKGFLVLCNLDDDARVYSIDADCVLGEKTVIFEERLRPLPSNKIAPETEKPLIKELVTEKPVDPKVVELIELLENKDLKARAPVATHTKPKPVVPLLIWMLKDEDERVRFASAEALKEITGQDFGEDYDKWLKWLGEQTSNDRRYKRCLKILNEPVTLTYEEKLLEDIIGDIAEQNSLSFIMRHSPLKIQIPEPVNFSCKNIPLSQALKQLLEPLDLQYTVAEEGIKGVIIIESSEENKDK